VKRSLLLACLLVVVAAIPARALEADPFGDAAPGPRFAATYSHYAVAADHPLASEAGASILHAGGNAADAAVATVLALGVASPASSGLGGGGFALYYRASDRSLTFLDFRDRAPSAATPTMFARQEGDTDAIAEARSQTGGLSVAVPGEPAGLEAILTRFGSGHVRRAAIAAPAERLAREGFPASRYVAEQSRTFVALLAADPLLRSFLPSETTPIPQGSRLVNPALARTIHQFGAHGAEPFYRGAIARQIVAAIAARGGIVTAEDLATYEVRERAPLRATRFGREIVTAPPPSAGGFTLLESLGLLERWMPAPREGAALRHALAESWIGPFGDRQAYAGDPDFADIPVDALLAEDRLARRAALFDPWRHRPPSDYALPLAGTAPAPTEGGEDHGTSHVCVVDAEGNVMALTTTVNLQFGARVTAAGMVLNDQMDDFAREVGVVNAFGLVGGAANLPGPGHRPVSTMSPTIVFDGSGAPILCVGASGGSRIVTAVEQVMLFTLLVDASVGDAVARARVHHQGAPDALSTEYALPADLALALAARGHDLSVPVEGSANVQAIRLLRDESGHVIGLEAASDPRKDGEPRGE
jgi:gamma-glutamyltranspeptidase/glutathione hydrolase